MAGFQPGRNGGNSLVRVHHCNNSSLRAGSPARPGRPLRRVSRVWSRRSYHSSIKTAQTKEGTLNFRDSMTHTLKPIPSCPGFPGGPPCPQKAFYERFELSVATMGAVESCLQCDAKRSDPKLGQVDSTLTPTYAATHRFGFLHRSSCSSYYCNNFLQRSSNQRPSINGSRASGALVSTINYYFSQKRIIVV